MANETMTTIVGNLTADPELRFTPNGVAVANFTVASTPRTFDRQSGEWRDGDALFLRCTAWRDAAEHVAESLTRGDRVVVQGRLRRTRISDHALCCEPLTFKLSDVILTQRAWSTWRRRHQRRARTTHYQRQEAALAWP